MQAQIAIQTSRQGLTDITEDIAAIVRKAAQVEGLCTIMVRHTSASLIIQENADPSAKRDLEAWLNRLVPEQDSLFTHTAEGPDDMPSHIKATLTATTLSIPIVNGGLGLGTWQGIYLWEHRKRGSTRQILIHIST